MELRNHDRSLDPVRLAGAARAAKNGMDKAVEDAILGDAGLLASRNLDNRLADLLAGLREDEKRRLLFELAQRQLAEQA